MEDLSEEPSQPATFQKASIIGLKTCSISKNNRFLKKRVKLNAVDEQVKEYELDEQERDDKKKGKTYQ